MLKKGFTLIELIIVISLIAILSGAAVPRLLSFSRSQNLEQSALDFENVLYEARSLSMSSVNDVEGARAEWGVLVINDSTYALGRRVPGTGNTLSIKKNYELSDNVTVSPSGGPHQSVFERISGRCLEGARSYTFTESAGSTINIVVYDNGRIEHE